ncbi:major capsid protein [Cryobacterium sp. BB736]|uniref:major capsid protein n=1 Tax=Cryobacterium sp. BB736 TaxID=2746963 RepID=UPI001873E88A|nr:hypothetical protein [Cryobacterium sp. BB736]
MAITLTEAAKLSQSYLQRGVLETFVQSSPVLDRIPFMSIQGNAYAYNEEATLPGVAFRAVNGSYTESTGTVNQKTETLSILGGDADVDKFIVQTRGDVNDQRAVQTAMKVKAASYKFQDTFFNGDVAVDANSFDGLKKRLTGGQVISTATNGAAILTSATTIHAFFDKLDELVAAVPGLDGGNGALYANAAIIGKIKSAARQISADVFVEKDANGKRQVVWQGIPILDAGASASGTAVLPQSETQGSSSLASSIYAVRFGQDEGDQAVTGLTNGGVQVYDLGELEEKPAYRTRIEFYTGVAVFGGKAAARLTGVLNA